MRIVSFSRVIVALLALVAAACDDPTSPGGREGVIAFDSFREGEDLGFYVMPARGGRATRLALPQTAIGQAIAWAPDGRRIAFVARVSNGTRSVNQIFIANADGTGSRQVTTASENDATFPAWSPDGNTLAYFDNGVGAWGINLVGTDGSAPTRIASTTRVALGRPTWSPLGAELAFVGRRDTPESQGLYIIRTDGSDLRPVTINGSVSAPAWSPNGTVIAYVEDIDDAADTRRIALIQPDGTNRRFLTDSGGFHTGPSWSPAGDAIAFQSSSRGGVSSRLLIIQVSSGRTTSLTKGTSYDQRPSWGRVSEP